MDLTPLLAAGIAGAIALAAQLLNATFARATSQQQIDYERWEAWRREGAAMWADLLAAVRDLDCDFDDLTDKTDAELAVLRSSAQQVIHGLDRLSILALDRRAADWSRQLARSLNELRTLLPQSHEYLNEDTAQRFQTHRELLHAHFDWNDGDRSSQLERFRDALLHSTDPPTRSRRRLRHARPRHLRSVG